MEVSLPQILDARERRVAHQQTLLARFCKPLICFTMNIAGPIKNTPLIAEGFDLGIELLQAQLKSAGIPLLHDAQVREETGCEGFFVADADPMVLKKLTCEIEDSTPIGRLFDMDVLIPGGSKVSREQLGLPGRKCLLCDNPVHICSRSRAHSVAELQQKTAEFLQQALWQQDSRILGALAAQSLLFEVCTTPKPGLVDCQNSGSHTDMDLFTFMASTAALQPYFTDCALAGIETAAVRPEETFQKLRWLGKRAEQTMLRATGGVNTHKGAIFSLGLLCGAAGRLSKKDRTPENLCAQCSAMVQGIVENDLAGITQAKTQGQRLYLQHGITGVRGQAEAGFPAVLQVALPHLREGLSRGLSINDAGCAALLKLIASVTDTNLIVRSDLATQQQTATRAAELLKDDPFPDRKALEQLDEAFIRKNLSPGGSADLLALTYFLHFLP